MSKTSGQAWKFILPTDVHDWQPSIECVVHTPCRGQARGRQRGSCRRRRGVLRGTPACQQQHRGPAAAGRQQAQGKHKRSKRSHRCRPSSGRWSARPAPRQTFCTAPPRCRWRTGRSTPRSPSSAGGQGGAAAGRRCSAAGRHAACSSRYCCSILSPCRPSCPPTAASCSQPQPPTLCISSGPQMSATSEDRWQ